MTARKYLISNLKGLSLYPVIADIFQQSPASRQHLRPNAPPVFPDPAYQLTVKRLSKIILHIEMETLNLERVREVVLESENIRTQAISCPLRVRPAWKVQIESR